VPTATSNEAVLIVTVPAFWLNVAAPVICDVRPTGV